MIETTQIEIPRFRDHRDLPTCATNGLQCPFLMNSAREYLCYWDTDAVLDSRDGGRGSLVPHESCPVWYTTGKSL